MTARTNPKNRTLEIFAGGGGLALAVARAGGVHEALLEWDANACNTLRHNGSIWGGSERIHQGDIRDFDYSIFRAEIDLITGGPPCQPFSQGGRHNAHNDARDMFPEAIRSIRELKPKAFVLENVKGLTRKSFEEYFEYILLQMSYPEIVKKKDEAWHEHRGRLEKRHTRGRGATDCEYGVVFRLLNAADYGVPQKRERIFFVGIRKDLAVDYTFPVPSHSARRLMFDKWITGEYWERHGIKPRGAIPGKHFLSELASDMFLGMTKPWQTLRDALGDLPEPNEKGGSIGNHEHRCAPAKQYVGHTGSALDEPGKTIKAGVHGVPGGENMLIPDRGTPRYLTVREAARLQSFPDNYIFAGSWTEAMRQIGNAVPVLLGERIAHSVAQALKRR